MIALTTIDRSTHGVDHQPARHRLRPDVRMQAQRGVEGPLRLAIVDEFKGHEQSATADVADVRVLSHRRGQTLAQVNAEASHRGEQVIALDHFLHGQRRGARDRVPDVGVAMLEEPACLGDCGDDLFVHEHRADRLIAAAQTLGDRHQVRCDTLLLDCVQRARAAHAAHHFVGEEKDAVPIADLANAAEVSRHRRHRSGSRADDRLGAEGDHVLTPEPGNGFFQLLRQSRAIRFGRLAGAPVAILVAGRDVRHIDQERCELSTTPLVSADRERAQRVAVIALTPGDEVAALRLTDLDEVLTGELECRFDRFRAARDEIDV